MDGLTDGRNTEDSESRTTKGTGFPGRLGWAGAALIAAVGLIHLLEAPEELEEATYLGLLFLANFGGAVVAAIGISRNQRWGWGLGVLLAGGALAGYVVSRTIGLPGMAVEEWLEPVGVLSLLIEGLFIALWLATSASSAKEVRMG